MMDNQDNSFNTASGAFTQARTFDEGLRSHMIRIFNTVGAGLAVSGAVAYAVANTPVLFNFFMNSVVSMVMGIGMLLFLWFGMNPNKIMQQSLASVQLKYYLFTAALGAGLAYVFVIYTGGSLARVFFITSATFFGVSLFGYTTKRDLTGMGTFLMMGLIGLIIASLVNMFLKSPGMAYVMSWIGVLVFTGLIAYDTQNAKRMYNSSASDDTNRKLAIYSSLELYLNFINLLQFMLRLFGDRR